MSATESLKGLPSELADRLEDILVDGDMPALKVNGNAGVAFATYTSPGTPEATDAVFFVAPRACRVKAISCVFAVAAGGTSTLQVTKDDATDAPGAGADLLSAAFDLNATANTVQSGTLVTTAATVVLAAGDRLAVDFGHAIQSTDGLVVTVALELL